MWAGAWDRPCSLGVLLPSHCTQNHPGHLPVPAATSAPSTVLVPQLGVGGWHRYANTASSSTLRPFIPYRPSRD